MRKLLTTILTAALAAGMALAQSSLPPEVEKALLEALTGPAGEYRAFAEYNAVIEKFGEVEPYVSIRNAEAKHVQSVKNLLDKYGIEYPAENPYLGEVAAPESLEEAARAWAQGEISNIKMYDELLPLVQDYPDIVKVFENLRRASLEKHLPAFQAAAEAGGTLTKAQMQELGMAHGGQGHGQGNCQGHGQGQNRP